MQGPDGFGAEPENEKYGDFQGMGKKRGLTRKNGCLEGIQYPFFIWCYRCKLDIAVKQDKVQ